MELINLTSCLALVANCKVRNQPRPALLAHGDNKFPRGSFKPRDNFLSLVKFMVTTNGKSPERDLISPTTAFGQNLFRAAIKPSVESNPI